MKVYSLIVLLWSSVAAAEMDGRFTQGPLEIPWGASLEKVQAAYPAGVAWPGIARNERFIVYAVAGEAKMLGLRTTPKFVHFVFTLDNKLKAVYYLFNYADGDNAFYDVAELLGQNYSIRSDPGQLSSAWNVGHGTSAQFTMGTDAQHSWAHLGMYSALARSTAIR